MKMSLQRSTHALFEIFRWHTRRPPNTLSTPVLAADLAREFKTKPANVRQALDMLGYRSAKFNSVHKGAYQYRQWFFHPDVPVTYPPMGRPVGAVGILNRMAYEILAAR
jgi:hypothetical protein